MSFPKLTIDRDRFLLPDGTDYWWKGNIDFMLYKRSLEGFVMEPLLDERYEAGSRCIVTLGMAFFIEHFYPGDYGQRYFEHIRPFAEALDAKNMSWMPIVFADADQIMPDKHMQIDFLNTFASYIAGIPNVFPSLANEFQKNGIDPGMFSKPSGNYWSRGSSTGDSAPYQPGWDWKEWHPRRDWPKVLFGNDDGWYVKEGIDANGQFHDRPMPCICSEPIGFWDHDVPGRRSSDPNLARVIGGTSVYFERGGNFMSEEGLKSQNWTPRTAECAREFFRAINQVDRP